MQQTKRQQKSEVENALKVLTNAKAALEKKVVVAKASAKLKAGKKKVTVKIKKASVSGYQIKYAANKNFKNAKDKKYNKNYLYDQIIKIKEEMLCKGSCIQSSQR